MSVAERILLGAIKWRQGATWEKNRLINLLCPGPNPGTGEGPVVENVPGGMGGRSGSGQ